jgi:hypothetical protein
VFAFGPKISRGADLAEDDAFLREIKKSVARLPWEGKEPSVQCLKTLRHIKEPYEYESDTSVAISRHVSPASLLDVSAGN